MYRRERRRSTPDVTLTSRVQNRDTRFLQKAMAIIEMVEMVGMEGIIGIIEIIGIIGIRSIRRVGEGVGEATLAVEEAMEADPAASIRHKGIMTVILEAVIGSEGTTTSTGINVISPLK